MKVISSKQTFFIKRVFPIAWLAFLGLFSIMPLILPTSGRSSPPNLIPFVLMPIGMAAFGAVLFRKLVWDLADEVGDGGDFLLVRKGSVEDRIRLADIMNVSTGFSTRPPRLTLRLRSPGKFGDEIAFIPVREFTFNPFARNPIAEDLIRRVDAARRDMR